jgi:uncharacterized protein YecT (DUF1311 family)
MASGSSGEADSPKTTKKSAETQKIMWDDSRMNTSYANVCNVLGSREEITLLFGANQAWHSGQKEVKVLLSDRVVLNPYAAKRLAGLLDRVLKEYESRWGQLEA